MMTLKLLVMSLLGTLSAVQAVDDLVDVGFQHLLWEKAPQMTTFHLLISTLEPLIDSMLGLTELLELRRLRSRESLGRRGLRPDWRANRLRTSVNEMTPVRRPESRAPGFEAADTAGNEFENDGDGGVGPIGDKGKAWEIAGVAKGVAGVDGEGDCGSTTHIR